MPDMNGGPKPAVLVYAPGGGLGHLQRSMALAGALLQEKARPVIVTSSPFSGLALSEGIECCRLGGSTVSEKKAALRRFLLSRRFDCIVVDTFPAGICGELAELEELLPLSRVLLARRLKDYPFGELRYGLVVCCEEGADPLLSQDAAAAAPGPGKIVRTDPVLVRRRGRLLPARAARKLLGLEDKTDHALLLVMHHGYGNEREALFRLVLDAVCVLAPRRWLVRLLSPGRMKDRRLAPYHIEYWPAVELFRAAELAVTAGGYHSVHELAMAGVPAVHVPMERKYDSQKERVLSLEKDMALGAVRIARDRAELRKSLEFFFRKSPVSLRSIRPPGANSGAGRAAREILRRLPVIEQAQGSRSPISLR